jgi:hypothetical protein
MSFLHTWLEVSNEIENPMLQRMLKLKDAYIHEYIYLHTHTHTYCIVSRKWEC